MASKTFYIDNNASTPVEPRVREVLSNAFTELYGNPSNNHHRFGKLAYDALQDSREKVRKLLHADGFQVIFTASATEALNLCGNWLEACESRRRFYRALGGARNVPLVRTLQSNQNNALCCR